MEPYISQIQPFACNFAPVGWAKCDGQILSVSQNTALFSLLGTTYGGDGRTSFGLPDLRGRTMVHEGSGPGLTQIRLGEKSGTETNTLTVNQLPAHNHTAVLHGETKQATGSNPANKMLAFPESSIYAAEDPVTETTLASAAVTIDNTGAGESINNRSPFLGVNVCIALVGVYPSRS